MIALNTHLIRIYRKLFRVHSRDKSGHPPVKKNSDQVPRLPKFNRSIILLFLTYFKVTQNRIKHSATIVHLKLKVTFTKLILADITSVKDYLLKSFNSILELQNHQISKVKTGLANHCNNKWRHLSNSGQSATSFSTQ